MIRKLVAHRLKLWWVYLIRGRKGSKLSITGSLIGVLFFVTASHFGAYGIFSLMERTQPGRALLYLPAIFGVVSAFGLVPILILTLYELYLQSDIDLLMASPIHLRELFASKFAGLVTATVGLVGLLFLSILTGYGRAVDVPPIFYVGTLALIAVITILLSAIDMSLVMLAARIMPAKRVQGLIFALSGVMGAGIWLAFQVFSRQSDSPPREVPFSPETPMPFSGPPPPQLRGLITSYPARALQALQSSDALTFVIQTGLFAAVTSVTVVLCFWIFKLTFYQGAARVGASASPSALPSGKQRLRERLAHVFPEPIGGLVTKDWLSFPRDLRYLANLIFPFVMVFYFGTQGFSPSAAAPGLWGSVAPVTFLSLLLTSGLVMPSIGMEGRNFGLLRSLPVSVDQILLGKFAAFFPLVLIATWTALVPIALYRGATAFELAGMLAGSLWLTMGITALGVGVGALGANFDAQSPNRAVSPAIAVLSMFVGVLFQGANGGLIFWLIERPEAGPLWLITLGLLVAALVTSALVGLILLAGRRHLQKVEI